MLIEQKAKQGDIIVVKLNSGEELVGKMDTQNPLKLNKPATFGPQQNPETGQVGLGFGQFMFAIDDEASITLEEGSYITMVKVRDEVKQAYTKATTGLEVPPSASLVV